MSYRIVILPVTIGDRRFDAPEYCDWADGIIPADANDAEVDAVAAGCAWMTPLDIYVADVADARLARLRFTLEEEYGRWEGSLHVITTPA